jgi:uncharacterized protein YecE (DUF72 family)
MPRKDIKSSAGVIRIGISGWTYAPWRGTFYPKKLAQKDELKYASSVLSTVEINGTFYSLQKPRSYADWYSQTPSDFVFSMKGGRFITHIKRLRDIHAPLANFFVSGLLRLNEKLGPILWQFPPNFQLDLNVFENFLALLPRSTKEAAKMLKYTDSRMKGRSWAEIDKDRPMRYAVEIRHESFATLEFIKLLRRFNVALVIADTGGKWPNPSDVTADFCYVRLHGPEEIYASGYTDAGLDDWAANINAWSKGGDARGAKRIGPAARKLARRDVYVYFDNDLKVRSPNDASRLAVKLGLRDSPLTEPSSV